MYEILKLWKFGDLQYIATINDSHYINLEQQIGKFKIDILKAFGEKAYSKVRAGYAHENIIEIANSNIYGRVFWYFANIFYTQKIPYANISYIREQIEKKLEVAKKYCEFCEMVR